MGCLWSHEPSASEHYERNENYSSGQIIRPSVSTASNSYSVNRQYVRSTAKVKPLFGEYKCVPCGRSWTSRSSWTNKYQKCSRCKKPVYPLIQRELRPSDFKEAAGDKQDHKRELCQMCQQLGYNCRNFK